jgi:translation initiation factor 2 subunit 1
MEFEEDELVLGIVDKIENMNVFVKLSEGKVGTIVTSEIAPGRIKNLREYVSPNKVIVCKVLRISQNHIDLSLRRVSAKEKKEVMLKYQQEKDIEIGLKAILKEKSMEIIQRIKDDFKTLSEFVEKIQLSEAQLEKYIPKEFLEKISKITEKKKKEVEVKKIVKLKCLDSNGVNKIKDILDIKQENVKIIYVSAGNYLISLKAEDYKKANLLMEEFTNQIEKRSKKSTCELTIEDKKTK